MQSSRVLDMVDEPYLMARPSTGAESPPSTEIYIKDERDEDDFGVACSEQGVRMTASKIVTLQVASKNKVKKQPKQEPIVAELKRKARSAAGERNQERQKRIARDKELKLLRSEMFEKDQAMINTIVEKDQALNNANRKLAQQAAELTAAQEANINASQVNHKLVTALETIRSMEEENTTLRAEANVLRARVRKLDEDLDSLMTEIKPLRSFRASVIKLT